MRTRAKIVIYYACKHDVLRQNDLGVDKLQYQKSILSPWWRAVLADLFGRISADLGGHGGDGGVAVLAVLFGPFQLT